MLAGYASLLCSIVGIMDKEHTLFQDESEDAILARIQEESLRYYNEVELPRRAAEGLFQNEALDTDKPKSSEPQLHTTTTMSLGTPVKEVFYVANGEGADGFHLAAGETYVYPTNYPIRKYQKSIIHSALFHNTLVSLPTGLGKTFIAAVVMYNYFRWFPQGKIVFMAPTRPLVAQQIRACHDIMAIPIKDTVEMTGSMIPADRVQYWKNKRVFFLTPQVMANDLRCGVCPATSFKCVVIDEAHRATKEYSYCHVIRELEKSGAMFRVLALSATPGSNIKAATEVVQNLRISTLELRGEDSPDVTPYTHAKQIEPISLSLSKNIVDFREIFLLILERYVKSLKEARLVTCNVQNLTKFQLLKASEKMRSKPPNGMSKTKIGILMSDFTVCMTLAHGLDLLQTYGLRAFYQYFTGCEDEDNRKAAFTRLNQDTEFHKLMDNLQSAVSLPMDQFWSHPKHEHLVQILKEHFSQTEEKKECDTKVIIFCQYRVVVSEVYSLLQKISPLIKPVMFIGQGMGKDKSGLPQKKQMEVMKQFREGKCNVLIATCVAEEGLDIGSVDLLILMEVQRSPVRLVQRLGRTGRHRKGRCVVLLTQGREVQKFNEAMSTTKSYLRSIQNSKVLEANLYKDEPAMIPSHLMPKMQLVHINVPERVTPGKTKKQSDIRQALINKLNDTEDIVESPFPSSEQIASVKEELRTLNIKFEKLSFLRSDFLFHRINEVAMCSEELFRPAFCQHSEYNEWNRVSQQTYLLYHSSDSEMLCNLLKKAETMQLGEHSDFISQVNSKKEITNKCIKKSKSNVENIKKQKKIEKQVRHGMDIRQCMALAANKVCLSQDYTDTNYPVITVDEISTSQTFIGSTSPSGMHQYKNNKDNMDIKLFKKIDCSLCNLLCNEHSLKLKMSFRNINNASLNLSLDSLSGLQIFLTKLTKENIQKINIVELFSTNIGCTIRGLRKNLTDLKRTSHVFNESRKSWEVTNYVNNIFATEFKTPPKDSSCIYSVSPNFMKINDSTKLKSLSVEEREVFLNPKKEFFVLEDIFNEDSNDDLAFHSLENVNKTSTPINEHKSVVTNIGSKNIASNKLESNHIENIFPENDCKIKIICQSLSPKEGIYSDQIMFKIPPLKLDFSACKRTYNVSNVNTVSPESPILSGQMITPSCSSTPKFKGKVLFDINEVVENRDSSLACFPLDSVNSKKPDNVIIDDEVVSEDIFSVSQLFDDDSNEEGKNENLDKSSMYTISQMLTKLKALSNDKESLNINLKNQNKSNEFGSMKEDSILNTENMDTVFNKKVNSPISTKVLTGNTEMSLKNDSKRRNVSPKDTNNAIKQYVPKIDRKSSISSTNILNQSTVGNEISRFSSPKSIKEVSQDITSKWLSCMKSPPPSHQFKLTSSPHSCAAKQSDVFSDSDSNGGVFQSPLSRKPNVNVMKQEHIATKENNKNIFCDLEADVTGPPCSSDEENTSGLDELDESFINDMTEHPSASVNQSVIDMQARYLQSVKSPMKRPGAFKIPIVSESVLAKDVFSQAFEEEDESYINDSFCCDSTEIPVEDDPSILEIAENILNKKKSRKINKKRKKEWFSNSDVEDKTNYLKKDVKRRRMINSDSSSDDQLIEYKNGVSKKRILSSDTSMEDNHPKRIKKSYSRKNVHLLTSDSDSDRTI